MKYLQRLTVIIAALVLFVSCNKLKENIKISVPATMEYEFIIPVVEQAGNVVIEDGIVELDIDALIKKENSSLSVSNLQSVLINSLEIKVDEDTKYDDDNLTALSSFEVSLASDNNPGTQVIAKDDKSPSNPYQYTVPIITDYNYAVYFNGKQFTYKVNATASRSTTKEIKCKATVKYSITAGL